MDHSEGGSSITSDPYHSVYFQPLDSSDRNKVHDIINDPATRSILIGALTASILTGDEFGFNIGQDPSNGKFGTSGSVKGDKGSVRVPNQASFYIGSEIFFSIAKFHTHPGNYENAFYPSLADVTTGNPLGLIVMIGIRKNNGSIIAGK